MHLARGAGQNGGTWLDCALVVPHEPQQAVHMLAYYVILSRPTSLRNLLSFGLPDRKIIEGGPPEEISAAFDKFFTDKIAYTKEACARARKAMGWPARAS